MKRILIVAVLCAGAMFAQSGVDGSLIEKTQLQWHSCGALNGFFWQSMATESQRIAFLMGYSEAWAKTTDGSIVWPKGATVGEVETGLQSFYYDSRNLVIPVSFALQIASDRLGGIESSEDINQNMPGVRKVWERCSERASKRY